MKRREGVSYLSSTQKELACAWCFQQNKTFKFEGSADTLANISLSICQTSARKENQKIGVCQSIIMSQNSISISKTQEKLETKEEIYWERQS